jgi:hypothetical protein
VPLGASLSIVKSGTLQRVRDLGVVGDAVSDQRGVTGSALVVLLAWAFVVVAGSVFAKYVEHWQRAMPRGTREVPSVAYGVVFYSSLVGLAIVSAAALVCVPAFVRAVRSRGWGVVIRPLRRALLAAGVALVTTSGVVAAAQHLASSTAPASWPYRVAFYGWGVVVALAIVICATAAGEISSRLDFSERASRTLGQLALAMSVVVVVTFAGVLAWWIAVASRAPWFLGSGADALEGRSSSVPLTLASGTPVPWLLVAVALTMLVSLALCAYATARIVTRVRRAS